MNDDHISEKDLWAFCTTLDDELRESVEAHVKVCDDCWISLFKIIRELSGKQERDR